MSNNFPEISISAIIPCHNCESSVADDVLSLQRQNSNFLSEIIIVNDGSTDASLDKIKELAKSDSRIKVFSRINPSGRPSIPRNIGIESSTSSHLVFLDADDILPNSYLETALVYTSNTEFCGSLKHPFLSRNQSSLPYEQQAKIRLLRIPRVVQFSKNVFSLSGLTVKKSALGELRFQNTYLEDWRLLVDLYKNRVYGNLLMTPKVFYRIGEKSITPTNKLIQIFRVYKTMVDLHGAVKTPVYFIGYFIIGLIKIFFEKVLKSGNA